MKQPSVKRNFMYRSVYELLLLALPFVTTPYISRVLGADGIGTYSYTSSIMTYFTLAAGLGTASYGAREIAQHRNDRRQASKLFWEIELMTVATSLVCLAAWSIVIAFGGGYRPYFIALIPVLLGTMMDISWFYTGYEQIQYTVSLNLVCRLLGVGLLFTLVKKPTDLWLYVVINSCVTLLGSVSMWIFLPRLLAKVDFRGLTFKRHFRETLIYFIPTIATSVYTVLDKTLIGAITHNGFQNGYYEQASKIMRIAYTFVFVTVNSVMGTRISYLFSEKRYDEIRQRIRRSMSYILLLGFAAAFGIVAIAERFVPAFFGRGYEPVKRLLYLMSPLVLIIGVSNCLGSQYYTPSGQRKQSAKYIIVGSIVNLAFNLALIPWFGAQGATIASIVAEGTIALLYLQKCDGYVTVGMLWQMSWKRLIAGIIMCGAVMLLGKTAVWPDAIMVMAQMALGAALYIGLLLLLKDQLLYELISMCLKMISGNRGSGDTGEEGTKWVKHRQP